MPVNNVSFGSVIAVTADRRKIQKINNNLAPHAKNGVIIMKDVTAQYRLGVTNGVLAKAAQQGDVVQIYITGDDVNKVKRKDKEWNTLDGILSHLSTHFSAKKMSAYEAVSKIFSY